MFAHDEVWTAIDGLATKNGLSPSGLARRSGLDPTTFNKSKRFAADGRPRWPSTESISKILRATNTSIGGLFGFAEQSPAAEGRVFVPLVGQAHAGSEVGGAAHGLTMQPRPPRIVSFPDRRHEPLFALSVVGTSMQPLYRDGDVLFMSTTEEPEVGDRVVVKLASGEILVKVLKAADDAGYDVHAVNPEHEDMRLEADDVEWVARIVYATQ